MAREIDKGATVSQLRTIDPTLLEQRLRDSGYTENEIATLRVVAATDKFANFPIESVLNLVISPGPIED